LAKVKSGGCLKFTYGWENYKEENRLKGKEGKMESAKFFVRKCMSVNHDRVKDLFLLHLVIILHSCSQWPCCLRRGSAVPRLLGLWVPVPPGQGWLSLVGVTCCQVQVSASGWSLVQRSPTECCMS